MGELIDDPDDDVVEIDNRPWWQKHWLVIGVLAGAVLGLYAFAAWYLFLA